MNKWQNIPYVWLEYIILLKCQYYPEQTTDSMQSWLKSQWYFKQEIEKSIPNINKEIQGPQVVKVILEENKADEITSWFQNLL